MKPRGHGIGCSNVDRIALNFDRHLGSTAAEVPVKFQSIRKKSKPKYRGFETSRDLTVRRHFRLVNKGPLRLIRRLPVSHLALCLGLHACLSILCIHSFDWLVCLNALIFLEIDECEDDTLHDCKGVALECENTPGNFRCVCDPGYTLQSDAKSCQGNASQCSSSILALIVSVVRITFHKQSGRSPKVVALFFCY